MPVELECTECNGYRTGCKACNETGVFKLTSCPKQFIDRNTIEVMRFVRDPLPPLAGGLLDQTQSFVDAKYWIENERKKWEAELGI